MSRSVPVAAFAMLVVAACTAPQRKAAPVADTSSAAPRPPKLLANTNWRLVELQSMDDAQGTSQPTDPARYTMQLNGDGTVHLRLDCNRASGTWTAEVGDDGLSGGFEFGPLAATMAACPPPSLGEKMAAQAPQIRGFILKDGRLSLSLMADGGTWTWQPVDGVPYDAAPDSAIEAAILRPHPDYARVGADDDGKARYVYSRVELNGDGRNEVIVYPMGSFFCGTGGCSLLILTPAAAGYDVVADIPTSRPPVLIAEERSQGWHDIVRLQSGGGGPAAFVRHRFDGKVYQEFERLPAEPVPDGIEVLAGEPTYQDGAILEPGR
jgi:heat shock protein HslJ